MKAICEINERRHQTEPSTFLAEIFRVIFRYFYIYRSEIMISFQLTGVITFEQSTSATFATFGQQTTYQI